MWQGIAMTSQCRQLWYVLGVLLWWSPVAFAWGSAEPLALEGNWFGKASLPVRWSGNLAIVGGDSTLELRWLQSRQVCGQGFCERMQLCSFTIPAVQGRWEKGWYGMVLANKLAEGDWLAPAQANSSWQADAPADTQAGIQASTGTLLLEQWTIQLGAAIPEQLSGRLLLEQGAHYQLDMDKDGFVGVTWAMQSDSPFVRPRTNMNLFSSYRAVAYHTAWHLALTMEVWAKNDNVWVGEMQPLLEEELPAVYHVILGCLRNDGTLCQQNEVDMANQHSTTYQFSQPGLVELQRAGEPFSCQHWLATTTE